MDAEIDKILAVNIFRYVVSAITIIGNGFLLFLFYKYPVLRQSQCNLLVLLLNICDLLIGKYICTCTYIKYFNFPNKNYI